MLLDIHAQKFEYILDNKTKYFDVKHYVSILELCNVV